MKYVIVFNTIFTIWRNLFPVPTQQPRWVRFLNPYFPHVRLTSRITGIAALLALGILENIQEQGKIKPLLEMKHNSAEYLHVLVEAMRWVGYELLTLGRGADTISRLAFTGTVGFCWYYIKNLIYYCFPFLDSEYYVTDPEFGYIPVNELLSKVSLAAISLLYSGLSEPLYLTKGISRIACETFWPWKD